MDEGGEDCEGLVGDSIVDLALVSGTEDYGPFKKVRVKSINNFKN